MSYIKETVRDQIVQPGMRETSRYKTLARVVESDERNNLCMIRFKDVDGETVTLRRVPVKIDKDTAGWFPEEKELVEIEKEKKHVMITGLSCENYEQEIRPRKKLKQDICSDGRSNTMPGAII